MAYSSYTSLSKYHPDNMVRPEMDPLPTPVSGPPPVVSLSEADQANGTWGHRLCCERPFGPVESRTRIKVNVVNKVGSNWSKTIAVEQGIPSICSAMYGGSLVPYSCSQAADRGVGSLKKQYARENGAKK